MQTITWGHSCYFCHRPIIRGKPNILIAKDKPWLLGLSHSICAAAKYHLFRHQMNPPARLSPEQTAFLVQFYPMLYSIPGGFTPTAALRRCLAELLHNYPMSMDDPMKWLHKFRDSNKDNPKTYEGDLDADYICFLTKVQRLAKENPLDVEFDFS
jgi:hypothetical protein